MAFKTKATAKTQEKVWKKYGVDTQGQKNFRQEEFLEIKPKAGGVGRY